MAGAVGKRRSSRFLSTRGRETQYSKGRARDQMIDIATAYGRYYSRVFTWCFRIVRNTEDAEDLAQDAFIHVMRKIHTFRGESHFSTWLYRVVMNTVYMRLRRKRLPQTPLHEALETGDDSVVANRALQTSKQSLSALIARVDLTPALEQIPPGFRTVIVLHDGEDYLHSEIAEIMGWTIGTSKSQLHRARMRLRKLLECSSRKEPIEQDAAS